MSKSTFNLKQIKQELDNLYLKYNNLDFIENDPISIPHQFTQKEDIEIMGYFAATLAWGQRKSIIKSCENLIQIFEHQPYDFIINHQASDLKRCFRFVHRTFNDTDLISIIHFLKEIYITDGCMEHFFIKNIHSKDKSIENGLIAYRMAYEQSEAFVNRTKKHIASPLSGSACKRLNMFLRWMVRKDEYGVDFGIWKSIKPSQLVCPLDVHVIRQANRLGLLNDEKADWKNALYLTEQLKKMDKNDPVKYDFALFGYGVN
jgi:uncharacterized protein (TIGR02757 family)